jgi:molybdopterin-guanine dinucleotide biosynthesis protein A
MVIAKQFITGLILAGGRGMRMGGVDKGLQTLQGKPMVAHVILRLQPQVDRIMINANQNQDRYREFNVPVWSDEENNYAGPLAGMQAGLIHCETAYMLTVPCDTPMLASDLVAQLVHALEQSEADIAVANTKEGDRVYRQPVFCLMKKTVLINLNSALERGVRKVDQWLAENKIVDVVFNDEAAFANINTLEELQRIESHA